MIKGNIFIIKLGINIAVRDIGINITLNTVLKKPDSKYLNKTLFIYAADSFENL